MSRSALAGTLLLACACAGGPAERLPASARAPQRIVSTAPSLTETLFALGAGNRVVGVSTWCRRPPEARALPKVGGFANPSVEAILALRPDLVLFVEGLAETAREMEALEVPTLVVDPEDLAGTEAAITAIARRVGAAERGRVLLAGMHAELARLDDAIAARPRPRVLMVISRTTGTLSGIYAVGPESYLGELLERAGADNVLADTRVAYPKVSLEEVLARDPDVILEVVGMAFGPEGFAAQAREAKALWSAYPGLKAVREDAVVAILDDALFLPGPRVAEQAWRLADVLHGADRD